jgi:hypothetical protein
MPTTRRESCGHYQCTLSGRIYLLVHDRSRPGSPNSPRPDLPGPCHSLYGTYRRKSIRLKSFGSPDRPTRAMRRCARNSRTSSRVVGIGVDLLRATLNEDSKPLPHMSAMTEVTFQPDYLAACSPPRGRVISGQLASAKITDNPEVIHLDEELAYFGCSFQGTPAWASLVETYSPAT